MTRNIPTILSKSFFFFGPFKSCSDTGVKLESYYNPGEEVWNFFFLFLRWPYCVLAIYY